MARKFKRNTNREGIVSLMNKNMVTGRPYTYQEVETITKPYKSGTVTSIMSYLKKTGDITVDNNGNIFKMRAIDDKKLRVFIANEVSQRKTKKKHNIEKVTDLTEQEFNDVNSMLTEGFDKDFVSRVTNHTLNKVEDVTNYQNYEDYKDRFSPTVGIKQLEIIMSQLESVGNTVNATISILKAKTEVFKDEG